MPKDRHFACPRPDVECTYPQCQGTYCGEVALLVPESKELSTEIRAALKEKKPVLVRGTSKTENRNNCSTQKRQNKGNTHV